MLKGANKTIQEYFFALDQEIEASNEGRIQVLAEKIQERRLDHMYRITEDMVKISYPDSILCSGYGIIDSPSPNLIVNTVLDDGKSVLVKFVVAVGRGDEWCVYHSLCASLCSNKYLDSYDHLKTFFWHVHSRGARANKGQVKKLIKFDEDVWKLYRK